MGRDRLKTGRSASSGEMGVQIRPRGSKFTSQHALEQYYKSQPTARSAMTSLDGCTVEEISYQQAASIILPYEWWGTMSRTRLHYGLWSPDGELIGAECLGGVYSGRALVPGAIEMILQRGACVYWKPPGAPSFLIKRALLLAYRDHKVEIVRAYADRRADEIGQIYQYLGWHYIGLGRGHGDERVEWHMKDRPADQWVTSRNLGHQGYVGKGAWARARTEGWESRKAPAKHEFMRLTGPRVGKLLGAEDGKLKKLIKPYPTGRYSR
jgi:hypothetical protein